MRKETIHLQAAQLPVHAHGRGLPGRVQRRQRGRIAARHMLVQHAWACLVGRVHDAQPVSAQTTHLRTGPLNYLFMHTGEAGAYCLGVFDNGAAGTLLGGISFRNVLVQYDRRNRRVGMGQAACQDIGAAHAPCPSPSTGASAGHEFIEQCALPLCQ